MIVYHIIPLVTGFLLDCIIGDPHWMPHPVRLMGRVTGFMDKCLMGQALSEEKRNCKKEKMLGILTVVCVLVLTLIISGGIVFLAWKLSVIAGIVVEAVLTCYCLAAKSLKNESMKVYSPIVNGDVEKARYAVSMIVGRDTDSLDESGIIRAAVETVAENTSDGVIAPLIYLVIGGPILGLMYKAVNTMDSMIGYHSERYEYFGKAAAIIDDVCNYIPSRISALMMIVAAHIGGSEFNGKQSLRVFKRDRFNHKSPNSAQTESVCAGALGVRLAGDAYYFGKRVSKPYIGDGTRQIEARDIVRVNRLMYITTYLTLLVSLIVLLVLALL